MDQASKKQNPWLIISIVLAIALVSVVVLGWPQILSKGNSGMKVLSSQEAAGQLLSFINEVYGEQIGTAALKEVAEENGLYKVTITINDNSTPVDQVVYVTKDAEIFIPQIIKISDMKAQFEQFKQQQNAQPQVNANVQPDQTQPQPELPQQ